MSGRQTIDILNIKNRATVYLFCSRCKTSTAGLNCQRCKQIKHNIKVDKFGR